MTKHRLTKKSKEPAPAHPHHHDEVEAAVESSRVWFAQIAADLETDIPGARRTLRAWLHTVRDRTPVENAVHLAAQLPELIRGMYYEGWNPSRVPVPHDSSSFLTDFARDARIPVAEVPTVAAVVTQSLSELFAPGHLRSVFATLPAHLRRMLNGSELIEDAEDAEAILVDFGAVTKGDRLTELEDRVRALSEAVAAMARGVEELPNGATTSPHGGSTAIEAHHVLLREGAFHDPTAPRASAPPNPS